MKQLIERKQYMRILRNLKDQNIIKVITGVRRCGKSTLLQMFVDELLQNGIVQEQIQFYNFEDLDTLALGDIFQIHTHIKNKLVADKMNYIFLDEIQNVKEFQRLVDSLFIKKNCDVYITGSNAYLLSGELATLLTGRYIETSILPLQFAEYYDFMLLNSSNLSKMESLRNYTTEGAVPEYFNQKSISQEQADNFMKSVLNTIVEKDIFQRLNIKDKHDFNKIIDFVFDSVGSYVSPRSIANTLRTHGTIVDNKTVTKYLDAMCDAFLLYKVPRYEIKGKELLKTLNKYYLVDPCFRKVRLKRDMKKDISHWLENIVYFELLRKNRDVYVGKIDNKEVDFVVTDHEGYTSYYQVAWSTMNVETLERELAPLNAIKDSNPKYLLTTDLDFNPVYGGIRKLNVVDWLLEEEVSDKAMGKSKGISRGISREIKEKSRGKILELIKNNEKISVPEIVEIIGLSISGVEKNIRQLKQEGKLSRTANTKSGSWIVNNS
ncbi:MAG: AAA family ATPase [Paludibacter sp.]|nr:AAA family ATPase [Paludibacter sp.]